MGGGKGKLKPIDGTNWLKDFRKGRLCDEPHQWRLRELLHIKLELHTFFASPERGQSPRKLFDQIVNMRSCIEEGLFSKNLLKEMKREVNAKEISLYQLLLPPEVYSKVTFSLPLCGPDRDSQQEVAEELLEKLRQAFSARPDKEKKIKTPIGKKLEAGSQRATGESWKSADIVSAYIWNVYELFKPFYSTSKRGWNKVKHKSEGGKFPFALIKTIVKFFTEEFSPWLDDLTEQDVISRIQYGPDRRVQRKIKLSIGGKTSSVVMRTRLPKMTRTPRLSRTLKRISS